MINDNPMLAKKLNADGCHLGQKDMDIISARKILGKKLSELLVITQSRWKKALKNNADYLVLVLSFQLVRKK